MTTQNVIVKVFRPIKLQRARTSIYRPTALHRVGGHIPVERGGLIRDLKSTTLGISFSRRGKLGERKRQVAHFDVFCSL